MQKTIITVVGKDAVGIIAKVSGYLYQHNVNILDISQTIIDGFFNMMMIVDMQDADLTMPELSEGLDEVGISAGVQVRAQHEDIFNMMHRV